jgi:hypothetical protein
MLQQKVLISSMKKLDLLIKFLVNFYSEAFNQRLLKIVLQEFVLALAL